MLNAFNKGFFVLTSIPILQKSIFDECLWRFFKMFNFSNTNWTEDDSVQHSLWKTKTYLRTAMISSHFFFILLLRICKPFEFWKIIKWLEVWLKRLKFDSLLYALERTVPVVQIYVRDFSRHDWKQKMILIRF